MTYIPESIRRVVNTRAKGCCEYCRINEKYTVKRHEVDHVYAEKHGGSTEVDNLCFSSLICNRFKGSDLRSLDPETNEISALFHPRRDIWDDHFTLQDTMIVGKTPKGRVTIKILQMNTPERLAERRILIDLSLYL